MKECTTNLLSHARFDPIGARVGRRLPKIRNLVKFGLSPRSNDSIYRSAWNLTGRVHNWFTLACQIWLWSFQFQGWAWEPQVFKNWPSWRHLAQQEWHYALIQAKFDVEETRVHHMSTVACKIFRWFGMYSHPAGFEWLGHAYDF